MLSQLNLSISRCDYKSTVSSSPRQGLFLFYSDVWLKDCHKIAPHSFLWGIDRMRERRGFESPINIVTSIVASCFVGDCGEHCLLNCEHFPLHSTSYLFEWPKVPISMIKKIENFTQHGDGIQRLSFCVQLIFSITQGINKLQFAVLLGFQYASHFIDR